MTGFWESDLGEVTGNAADAFAKSFTQIPDGTMALAKIESFANAEYNGNKYIVIQWLLTDGDFKGSKVEQKLKVFGDPMSKDSSKARHRALNMLKLIYQLYNIKPKHAGDPSDQDLSAFVGKSAGIKIRETEPNDQGRQYNWVSEVHEAKGFKCETGISVVVTHTNVQPGSSQGPLDSAFNRNPRGTPPVDDLSNDIPF
jgi:hypothetical protein